jgi:hypothetical protein
MVLTLNEFFSDFFTSSNEQIKKPKNSVRVFGPLKRRAVDLKIKTPLLKKSKGVLLRCFRSVASNRCVPLVEC